MKRFNLSTVWLVPTVFILYVFSASTLCGDPSWLQVCTGQWKRPSQSSSSKWSLWFRRCIDRSTSSPCLLILNIQCKNLSQKTNALLLADLRKAPQEILPNNRPMRHYKIVSARTWLIVPCPIVFCPYFVHN